MHTTPGNLHKQVLKQVPWLQLMHHYFIFWFHPQILFFFSLKYLHALTSLLYLNSSMCIYHKRTKPITHVHLNRNEQLEQVEGILMMKAIYLPRWLCNQPQICHSVLDDGIHTLYTSSESWKHVFARWATQTAQNVANIPISRNS